SPSLNFGMRGVFNSVDEFADKRFHGRPNYFYLRAAGQYRSAPWHGFSLVANLAGQYAPDALIGNEQFTIGGADGVRGYLEAEDINDIGLKGGLQLESRAWKIGLGDATLGGFLFYDAGIVSAVGTLLPDEVRRTDLSSAGIGLVLLSPSHFDGSLTWAYPL